MKSRNQNCSFTFHFNSGVGFSSPYSLRTLPTKVDENQGSSEVLFLFSYITRQRISRQPRICVSCFFSQRSPGRKIEKKTRKMSKTDNLKTFRRFLFILNMLQDRIF